MLAQIIALPEHEFWSDNLQLPAAIEASWPVTGYKQLTDTYLLGLAKARGGRLATLDRRIATLLNNEDLVLFL